ncbi:MAG: hypothetical protein PHU40_01060 [Sulfurimonas sp.]|nr:hypothetical protein [Sulfurimonas sp.]
MLKLIDSRTPKQKTEDKLLSFLKAQEWILGQTTSNNLKELYSIKTIKAFKILRQF